MKIKTRKFPITKHAVERYRERVYGCCDLTITWRQTRRMIEADIAAARWQNTVGGGILMLCGVPPREVQPVRPTHTIIMQDNEIITVYGLGMTVTPKMAKFHAERVLCQQYERYEAAVRALGREPTGEPPPRPQKRKRKRRVVA